MILALMAINGCSDKSNYDFRLFGESGKVFNISDCVSELSLKYTLRKLGNTEANFIHYILVNNPDLARRCAEKFQVSLGDASYAFENTVHVEGVPHTLMGKMLDFAKMIALNESSKSDTNLHKYMNESSASNVVTSTNQPGNPNRFRV